MRTYVPFREVLYNTDNWHNVNAAVIESNYQQLSEFIDRFVFREETKHPEFYPSWFSIKEIPDTIFSYMAENHIVKPTSFTICEYEVEDIRRLAERGQPAFMQLLTSGKPGFGYTHYEQEVFINFFFIDETQKVKPVSFSDILKDIAKLGTYLPSIMSIWKESIPPSSSSFTSLSRFP